MKISTVGRVVNDPVEGYTAIFTSHSTGKRRAQPELVRWPLRVFLESGVYDPNPTEPLQINATPPGSLDGVWICGERVIQVVGGDSHSKEQLVLRIKHAILRETHMLDRIQREVQAFENLEKLPSARRESIPDSVRLFVWQRDEGKCVRCGNRERLEFDHIVPIGLGGSNTERNIQLLCEQCNRAKGKKIC